MGRIQKQVARNFRFQLYLSSEVSNTPILRSRFKAGTAILSSGICRARQSNRAEIPIGKR